MNIEKAVNINSEQWSFICFLFALFACQYVEISRHVFFFFPSSCSLSLVWLFGKIRPSALACNEFETLWPLTQEARLWCRWTFKRTDWQKTNVSVNENVNHSYLVKALVAPGSRRRDGGRRTDGRCNNSREKAAIHNDFQLKVDKL